LRNRDILRLVYLRCGWGVVTSGGVGRRRGALIGRDIKGADNVLRDSRILGIVPSLPRIIVPYWTLISTDLLRESGAAATSIIASIAARTISFLMFSLLSPTRRRNRLDGGSLTVRVRLGNSKLLGRLPLGSGLGFG
jgi:hypothetical protein